MILRTRSSPRRRRFSYIVIASGFVCLNRKPDLRLEPRRNVIYRRVRGHAQRALFGTAEWECDGTEDVEGICDELPDDVFSATSADPKAASDEDLPPMIGDTTFHYRSRALCRE